MEIKYNLDKFYLPKTVHIVAGSNEDKEELARISSRLLVDNPAVAFANAAKSRTTSPAGGLTLALRGQYYFSA